MLFACNIEHAEELATMLAQRQVAARAIHYLVDDLDEKRRVMQQFRNGDIRVLVNVQMCTHGIDIPEIDTVVLARPTQSPVLCAQMVGRGARIILGEKEKFIILEFTDNIQNHGDIIFHAQGLFDAPTPPINEPNGYVGTPYIKKHEISDDPPQFLHLRSVPGVEGITFVADQTFGVEIELTSRGCSPVEYGSDYWNEIAHQIIDKLRNSGLDTCPQPGDYHEYDYITHQWRVEYDSSVGWEVISPILVGEDGFKEIHKACEALSKFCDDSQDITVDHKTGLHVTLATKLNTDARLRGFLKRVQRLEPGLFSLVAPSRLFKFDGAQYNTNQNNFYCRPIRGINVDDLTLEEFLDEENRCYSVNITKFGNNPELLEVRMHSGTTDHQKIIPWISLWMNIFNCSRYQWRGEGIREVHHSNSVNSVENDDLFELLRKENILLPRETADLLHRRRRELMRNWAAVIPNRVEAWKRAGWDSDGPLPPLPLPPPPPTKAAAPPHRSRPHR